jgi:hypothetical protein
VTESAAEVTEAKKRARRDSATRKGYASTLLAGETGGAATEKKSLLGL